MEFTEKFGYADRHLKSDLSLEDVQVEDKAPSAGKSFQSLMVRGENDLCRYSVLL